MSSCICKWLPTISTDANTFSAEPQRLAQLKLQQQTVALKNGYPGSDKVRCKINNARWLLDQEQFTSTAIGCSVERSWRRLAWDSRRISPTPATLRRIGGWLSGRGDARLRWCGAVHAQPAPRRSEVRRVHEPLKRKKPRALVALGAFWSRQPA